jgi:hypothetical protein
MKTPKFALVVLVALASLVIPQRASAAGIADNILLFDSYTPPNRGGFSSGNQGLATQLTVSTDTRISGFSILNEMTQPGNLRFAILSFPSPGFIVLTNSTSFSKDLSGVATWKTSGPLDILLQAGKTYLFGYVHDISLNDYVDYISESQNGIVSNKKLHILSGFNNPTYDRLFNSGADSAVRLYAIPESSTCSLVMAFVLVGAFRRRRCVGS